MRLFTEASDRESYRRDETAYYRAGLPLAVALPTTTAQVATLVALCGEFDVPIVPRGAGTGLSGAAAGIEGALTIAFTRMNRVLEIDAGNLIVTTQPGVVNADLKAAVAAQGLFYAPDPASYETCTIGGNLGTNAGGLCCVKYGVTRDAVLGLEVVMADATVLRLGGKNVKDVAGLRADPAAGRVAGDARAGHRGDAPAAAGPAAAVHPDRVLPLARGGGRCRCRAHRCRPAPGDPGADGPDDDPGRRRCPPARTGP